MSTARKGHCQHCGAGFDCYRFRTEWDRLWFAYCEHCGTRCPHCRKEVPTSAPAACIIIDNRVAMERGGELFEY